MSESSAAKETGRVEAFSDGVFAIAITLLGFTLRVPADAGAGLGHALVRGWPSLVAFVTSFATIGIVWINHHRLFTHIRRVNHSLLLLNALLLMTVSLVPFATTMIAEYIGLPGQRTAAMCYSGVFVLVTGSFNLLWRYSAHRGRLLDRTVDAHAIHRINVQYGFGPVLYVASTGLAMASVWLSLAADMLIAAFFALPALDWRERQPASHRPSRASDA